MGGAWWRRAGGGSGMAGGGRRGCGAAAGAPVGPGCWAAHLSPAPRPRRAGLRRARTCRGVRAWACAPARPQLHARPPARVCAGPRLQMRRQPACSRACTPARAGPRTCVSPTPLLAGPAGAGPPLGSAAAAESERPGAQHRRPPLRFPPLFPLLLLVLLPPRPPRSGWLTCNAAAEYLLQTALLPQPARLPRATGLRPPRNPGPQPLPRGAPQGPASPCPGHGGERGYLVSRQGGAGGGQVARGHGISACCPPPHQSSTCILQENRK